MLWDLCFKYKKWNIETLNYRKINCLCVCCGADKRSALCSSNESWDFVMLLFRLLFDFLHMQTTDKQNKLFLLEPAERNCVSLEAWALFVNIVVSEIEQKTILQFKTLKINLFFIELLPWHEEKSATDHANKTYNPSKCLRFLERPCII